ncbi:hypothetical protein C8R43DRAFT_899755 [Mycena crocata]|nr:hypothetical protein C8R43DRAFT_899755 [Mycena crocata]
MSLQQIAHALQSHPELALLDFHGLNLFIRYTSLARESIKFSQDDRTECLVSLPPRILRVLATALGEKDTHLVQICWAAFRGLVWTQSPVTPTDEEILGYNDAALPHQTFFHHLYPLVRSCHHAYCPNHRTDKNILSLTDPLTYNATLFTLRHGALPVLTSSLYCRRT